MATETANPAPIEQADLLAMSIDLLTPLVRHAPLLRASGIRLVAPPDVLHQLRERGSAGSVVASALWLVDGEIYSQGELQYRVARQKNHVKQARPSMLDWSSALAGLMVGAGIAAFAVASMQAGFDGVVSISPVAILSISAGFAVRWLAMRK